VAIAVIVRLINRHYAEKKIDGATHKLTVLAMLKTKGLKTH